MNERLNAIATIGFFLLTLSGKSSIAQERLRLNEKGYLSMPGLEVMVFSDIYPEGHQTGVTLIQHGIRVAANGDLRLEPSPGQWSPVPKGGKLTVDANHQKITRRLWYPDSARNRTGFNPIAYPDLTFQYEVSVTPLEGSAFKITVDLDTPLPKAWIGKAGFNFELFPGSLFGKAFLLDDQPGYFPIQPSGPLRDFDGEFLAQPLATGKRLVVAPEEDKQRLQIEAQTGALELWDGRTNHNNGWFIVRSAIPANAATAAVEWIVTPQVISGWRYEPVIQVSQVGYHPDQPKAAVIRSRPRRSHA